VKKDTSGSKFFNCDICKWQTRFQPALKGHMKRMHSQTGNMSSVTFPCNEREYKTKNKPTLLVHMNMKHKKEGTKRPKVSHKCEVIGCECTIDCEIKLNKHKKAQHEESNYMKSSSDDTHSLSSSPPRKKLVTDHEEEEMFDLDDMEIRVEKELNNKFLLLKKIKELEAQVDTLRDHKKMDEEFKAIIFKTIDELII
jgi:hypothetical protein